MANFILNDTANNIVYMNYFNPLTNGEVNLGINNSQKNANVVSALRALHTTNFITSDTHYIYAFFNTNKETKTNTTASSTNYRFKLLSAGSSFSFNIPLTLNSSTLTDATRVDVSNNLTFIGHSNYYEYGIFTPNTVSLAAFPANGNALNTATRSFLSCGWLEDAQFSGRNTARSLYGLGIVTSTVMAFRVSAENLTTAQAILTTGLAQYPITCVTSGLTPSDAELWCTDLWLRDNPSGYAVGRIPHVLMTNNNVLNLGELVYIDSVIDGITDQKLLMRVQTENVTNAV